MRDFDTVTYPRSFNDHGIFFTKQDTPQRCQKQRLIQHIVEYQLIPGLAVAQMEPNSRRNVLLITIQRDNILILRRYFLPFRFTGSKKTQRAYPEQAKFFLNL